MLVTSVKRQNCWTYTTHCLEQCHKTCKCNIFESNNILWITPVSIGSWSAGLWAGTVWSEVLLAWFSQRFDELISAINTIVSSLMDCKPTAGYNAFMSSPKQISVTYKTAFQTVMQRNTNNCIALWVETTSPHPQQVIIALWLAVASSGECKLNVDVGDRQTDKQDIVMALNYLPIMWGRTGCLKRNTGTRIIK